jgi:hypothetical protein
MHKKLSTPLLRAAGVYFVLPINPGAVEGPGRPVRRSGPFYTLAYFYYTTIYHLLPLLASVWACESGGVVGMVNTNLEKMPRQDQATSIAGATTVAGGDGRRPPNNINYHIF